MSCIRVALVLPVRNRKAYTLAILHQLSSQIAQAKSTIDIVVVDDGSSDGTPQLITQNFEDVHLIQGDGELWWTGAISTGMEYIQQQLQTDYIVWLNDDITLSDDFISQLVELCQNNRTKNVITGGIVCDQTYSNWIVFGGVIASCPINNMQQFSETAVLPVDTLNGNIVVFPTQLITDIGLPNVQRFRHYGGDYEYVCRAQEAGYAVQLSSQLQATTNWQPSDVIRYMPLWVQMYVSRGLTAKFAVIKSLTSRKSPHNVEHMVNSMHRQAQHVPRWVYTVFHAKKLVKLIGSELIPPWMRRKQVEAYFQRNNVPGDVVQSVLR